MDFVLAFPQANLERDVLMELPYDFEYENKGQYVLRLKKNLYGLADASYNWFQKLTKGLESEGFQKSDIDQCFLLQKDCIILVYADDMITLSKDNQVLEDIVHNLKKKEYILTNEGAISKYLGVNVKKHCDGSFELVQPFQIQKIIDLLSLEGDSKHNSKPTPVTKPLLHKDVEGEGRNNVLSYLKAIGILTYLQESIRSDISMAVH